MEKPWSVYCLYTGEILCQCPTEEYAQERMWEISNEDDRFAGIKLAITHEAEWNQSVFNG